MDHLLDLQYSCDWVLRTHGSGTRLRFLGKSAGRPGARLRFLRARPSPSARLVQCKSQTSNPLIFTKNRKTCCCDSMILCLQHAQGPRCRNSYTEPVFPIPFTARQAFSTLPVRRLGIPTVLCSVPSHRTPTDTPGRHGKQSSKA